MNDFLEYKWNKVRAELEELCKLYDELQTRIVEINRRKNKCLKAFEEMRKDKKNK